MLICIHFPMAATRINKEACHFDVASDPFKCYFSALMWPQGTLERFFGLGKKKDRVHKAY